MNKFAARQIWYASQRLLLDNSDACSEGACFTNGAVSRTFISTICNVNRF